VSQCPALSVPAGGRERGCRSASRSSPALPRRRGASDRARRSSERAPGQTASADLESRA
jgi:hypothetical protein